MRIKIYDTTLRDGTQAAGVSFSLLDKLHISQELDKLGFDYIEGGWPGSNPKDMEFFKRVKSIHFNHAKIAAFGSTRRKNIPVEKDSNIISLLEAETPVVTIFGKSWILHVRRALLTDESENLRMIDDSISFLKRKNREVIFDAEHFFDGYKENPDYALKVLKVAESSGADCIVLCDSNGGSMPYEIDQIVRVVKERINCPLGIHAHNDSGVATANTVIAARIGVEQVQGTINGYGERCGNADLCAVIPNLKLKLDVDCISKEGLRSLTRISRLVSELANLVPFEHQPYVGRFAFTHKGGVHASAISREKKTYEHIDPELVGNKRRVIISELAGKSSVIYKLNERGLGVKNPQVLSKRLIEQIKKLENEGYEFEAANGSFELLVKKNTGDYRKLFNIEGFRVIVEKRENGKLVSEATVKLNINGKQVHTVAEGNGPVNALDKALRKALEDDFPQISQMHLSDYKVRILDAGAGTEAKTRVLIESSDKDDRWGTVGVSPNIIEASFKALLDAVEYKLNK
ncbi:citramalate synthase [Candidatus Aerophobetes bacterium]|uniref:Citramalate synthase n=2 Tax=Aerophobetes bacterium TaxID=2030807 RepID=A0A662DK45_UNCAE|nr:MAG: citramalate synthase [Candidatus Aerophobetes bacterium]